MTHHSWYIRKLLISLIIAVILLTTLGTSPASLAQVKSDTLTESISSISHPNAAPLPTWTALPNQGLQYGAHELAASGDSLFVGGEFTQTGDGTLTDLGNIARYDFATDAWYALANQGLEESISALAVVGDYLYVGGAFTRTGDGALTDLGYIARYDPATEAWHALPNQGLDDLVRAFAVIGDDLYMGGSFTRTGDGALTDLGYIVRYNTTSATWHALPRLGLNSFVTSLDRVGDHLFVGGFFSQTGDGALTNLGNIVRYDTTGGTWIAMPNQGLGGMVHTLAVVESDLYVGGSFTQTADGILTNLGNIARYDTASGGNWSALPNQGLDDPVFTLAVSGGNLYAGGSFNETGDGSLGDLGHIACYHTSTDSWQALSDRGLNGSVYSLALSGGHLYVAGEFTQTRDGALADLGSIVRYDTTVSALIQLPNQGLNDYPHSLEMSGSDLYVGGNFTQTGDGSVSNLGYITRYDTLNDIWHALSDQGLNGSVFELAASGGDLYVGGDFTQTGGGSVGNLGNIARYDTVNGTWHALSNQGLNGIVRELLVVGDQLYVGGNFTQTGDGMISDLGCIARYDTSTGSWHALSRQGLDNTVYALAMVGSDLYVGGSFTQSGDGSATWNRIARYNTKSGTWHALPNKGLDDSVRTLAAIGDNLYVGGQFLRTSSNSQDMIHIARYNTSGSTWHDLPSLGLDRVVYTLEVSQNDLYAGGAFNQTAGAPVSYLNHIAHFDTATGTWHAFPYQGLNGPVVLKILVSDDDLYAGGNFTATQGLVIPNLGYIAHYRLARPEIQVLDGIADIPDGVGVVDFGTTLVGMPLDKTFTVKNTGTADLVLSEPVTTPPGFSLSSSFGALTLRPAAETNFTLRLDAAAGGAYGGSVEFAHNDPDENPFNFTVGGLVSQTVFLPLVSR